MRTLSTLDDTPYRIERSRNTLRLPCNLLRKEAL